MTQLSVKRRKVNVGGGECSAISNPTAHTGTERINGLVTLVMLVMLKQEIKLSKLLSQHGLQEVT